MSQGSTSPRTTPIRVLLVDDVALMRHAVSTLLEPFNGLELAGEAVDGVSAVNMASTVRPDVIVMDVQMPQLNGVEATRRIKQALPHVSVIGFSVQNDPATHWAMREAGASACVAKDRAGDLPHVIEQLTGRCISR